MSLIKMHREQWVLEAPLGHGTFGAVYKAHSPSRGGVVKLVRKVPGADRELLFTHLAGRPNIVPIIDVGETEDHWALAMPMADKSLRMHLEQARGPLSPAEVVRVLCDIATALDGLAGEVVHRDVKPENILLLDGRWCLADFGISRYSDATTSHNTRNRFLTKAYAAPEQWEMKRATPATDIYAVGVIGYEMLLGYLPFPGPDFREQHLSGEFPRAAVPTTQVGPLIESCLYKAPEARPSASDLLARLRRVASLQSAGGRARLQEAHAREVARRSALFRRHASALAETDNRAALYRAGQASLERIASTLRDTIVEAAFSAYETPVSGGGFSIQLGHGLIEVEPGVPATIGEWRMAEPPSFDVIMFSGIRVSCSQNLNGFMARSHSLWYCDAREKGWFKWFETAFMHNLAQPIVQPEVPFQLSPGPKAGAALVGDQDLIEVAWPFTAIDPDDPSEFVDRWSEWLGLAAVDLLKRPDPMPEHDPAGSWRR